MKEIQDLFSQFEFRMLGLKVAEALSLEMPEKSLGTETAEEIYEVGILLWIVDSNKMGATLDEILSYTHTENLNDAKTTLLKIIKDQSLSFILENIELPLIPITKDMKEIGIKVDTKRLIELGKKYHAELTSFEKKIWKITGEEFNINSPKQLGEMLFVKMGLKAKNQKRTASGGFSTKESELEKLKDEHQIGRAHV